MSAKLVMIIEAAEDAASISKVSIDCEEVARAKF